MFDTGRLCMKVAGREAGKYCVVLKALNDRFVLVTGPLAATGVKRRKCNVTHLEPLPEKLAIRDEAADAEVLAAFEQSGALAKYGIPKPTAEQVARAEQVRAAAPKEPEAGKQEPKKKEKKAPKQAKDAKAA